MALHLSHALVEHAIKTDVVIEPRRLVVASVLISLFIGIPSIVAFKLAEEFGVLGYNKLLRTCKQRLGVFAGWKIKVLNGLAWLADDLFFGYPTTNLNSDCHVFTCSQASVLAQAAVDEGVHVVNFVLGEFEEAAELLIGDVCRVAVDLACTSRRGRMVIITKSADRSNWLIIQAFVVSPLRCSCLSTVQTPLCAIVRG